MFCRHVWVFVAALAFEAVGALPDVKVGDDRLEVHFSAEGALKAVLVDGRELLSADVCSTDFACGTDMGEASAKPLLAIQRLGVTQVNANIVRTVERGGPWILESTYELHPELRAVKRSFKIEWVDDEPGKLKGLWTSNGKFLGTGDADAYFVPGVFPPRRYLRNQSEGQKITAINGPNVLICSSDGWTVTQLIDESRPYSDRGKNIAIARKDGFSLATYFRCEGHVRKGRPQEVGDSWLVFRRGTLDGALQAMPAWFDAVGQHVPTDRPLWTKHAIIYSMHPAGCRENIFRCKSGMAGAERHLPRLKELGVNLIWIRPIEDGGVYIPDDYYSFNTNYATSASLLSYVRAAHSQGIRVWRDAVMHGGNKDCKRAVEHPEWLAWKEDGSIPYFRGFDFNAPGWIRYFSEWIEYETRKHELDGWRLDVPHGTRYPNWRPDIPYARASFSMNQGGLAQQRAIRTAMRRVSTNTADLAESTHSVHSTCSDMIYDQDLCHFHYPQFRNRDAASMVVDLREWLYEQQLVFVPDTIHLRYPESHDSMRAALLYGRPVATAMMAMCAWIRGVPLLYQEEEDEDFDAFRRILRTRTAIEELSEGAADYRSVQVPPGVFACLRKKDELESIVLVNFNAERVRGEAVWYGGVVSIDLPPFGYDVVRVKGPSVPMGICAEPSYASAEPSGTEMPVVDKPSGTEIGLVTPDGASVKAVVEVKRYDDQMPYEEQKLTVRSEQTPTGCRVWVEECKGVDPSRLELVIRLPRPAGRWFARTAEGLMEGPYVERHPGERRYARGVRPCEVRGGIDCDGRRFYDSRMHPLRPDNILWGSVGFGYRGYAIIAKGFEQTAAVQLQHGYNFDVNEPCIVIRGPFPSGSWRTFDCELSVVAPEAPFKGLKFPEDDYAVRMIAGGWRFERNGLRVEIGRNGALRGVWKKVDGAYREIVGSGGWHASVLDGGDVPKDGPNPEAVCKEFLQAEEFECNQRILDDGSGRIVLEFDKGVLTPAGDRARRDPIVFLARYVFKPNGELWLQTAIKTPMTYSGKNERLYYAFDRLSGGFSFGDAQWIGGVPKNLEVTTLRSEWDWSQHVALSSGNFGFSVRLNEIGSSTPGK